MKLKEKVAVGYIRANLRILAALSKKRAAQKALKLLCTPFNKTYIKTTPLFSQAEKLQFTIDDKKVVGYRWNHPGKKKFLVIHGFHSCAKKFERYITLMINKGYEVLAFDAHAHGESEGKQVNVLQYKNMIVEICKRYGPVDAYLAHSFGGLAVSLALENIHHTAETKLVLIAPVTETTSAVDMFFNYLKLSNTIREPFEDLFITIGGVTVKWLSISRAIKNIRAKVLWVHDEEDDITPLKDVLPLMQEKPPNVKFLVTTGWGHRQVYHEEKVINAINDFL